MLRSLADPCIWLDLVKDCRREPVPSAVEDPMKGGSASRVIPRVAIDEFTPRTGRADPTLMSAPARSG